MCQSYKYFEMSHLGKTACDHGQGDKSEPEKNLKKKMALWYFRNNYLHKRSNE